MGVYPSPVEGGSGSAQRNTVHERACGMVIDGSSDSDRHIREMLLWDVNNGIARRSWARNEGAMHAIQREMDRTPGLKVTLPNIADEEMIKSVIG